LLSMNKLPYSGRPTDSSHSVILGILAASAYRNKMSTRMSTGSTIDARFWMRMHDRQLFGNISLYLDWNAS
jgi:hypothetical protein